MSFIFWDAVLGEHSSIFAMSLVVMQIRNNFLDMVYTLSVARVLDQFFHLIQGCLVNLNLIVNVFIQFLTIEQYKFNIKTDLKSILVFNNLSVLLTF
jgi:hypothetical protein